jgi:predicted ATPase
MNKITFENYKSFKDKQELVLKPITILLGKNSSGKSSIAKLPSMIEHSLKGEFPEPLQLINDEVELGAEFRDLMHGRKTTGANALKIGLYSPEESLEVSIFQTNQATDLYSILKWEHKKNGKDKSAVDSNKFNGFLLSEDERQEGDEFVTLQFNADYIGPFRKFPERSYNRHLIKNKNKFGIHGENAYPILIQDAQEDSKDVISKVSDWYQAYFDGWLLRINAEKSPFYQVELGRKDTGVFVNIKDVGQGMSQALPIVTRAFLPAKEETLIILEQPELHLHPAVHGDLGELFVNSVVEDTNKKYLIETHSQNLLLRIRSLVASGVLNASDLQIYFVDFNEEDGVSNLKSIDVDVKGNVSFWPDDIFNESFNEARRLSKAQRSA